MQNERGMFTVSPSSAFINSDIVSSLGRVTTTSPGLIAPVPTSMTNFEMPSSSEASVNWLQHRHDSVASSGSGSSSSSNGPNSVTMRPTDECAFCGIKEKSGVTLLPCSDCKTAKYCGQEHQNFDRKRHKPVCLTIQGQQFRDTQRELNKTAASKQTSPARTLQGLQLGSTSSAFSRVTPHSNSNADPLTEEATTCNSDTSTSTYRVINTDDPDIQIIENPKEKPHRMRSVIQVKDHRKNELFKMSLQDHMRSLAASGVAVNRHQAISLRLKYISEHVIKSLNDYGWAVIDNFLGLAHCRQTHREIDDLYKKGLFSDGMLMGKNGESNQNADKDVRSDEIYWFDSSDTRVEKACTIRLLISMIDSVTVHFNNRIPPYNISGRSRAMIAVYPGNGTRYVKHVDNPIRDGRCVTSIYYCNEKWDLNKDGGTLRLYPESSACPMDIDPQADRLVFFWSDRRNPHEVLPVYRNRFAITIWYFDQGEKEENRRRTMASSDREDEIRAKSAKSDIDDKDAAGTSPQPSTSGGEDRRPSYGHVQGTHFPESDSFSKTSAINPTRGSFDALGSTPPENASSIEPSAPKEKVRFGLHPERSLSSESAESGDGDDGDRDIEDTFLDEEKGPEYQI